jgi:hypothetical protein
MESLGARRGGPGDGELGCPGNGAAAWKRKYFRGFRGSPPTCAGAGAFGDWDEKDIRALIRGAAARGLLFTKRSALAARLGMRGSGKLFLRPLS